MIGFVARPKLKGSFSVRLLMSLALLCSLAARSQGQDDESLVRPSLFVTRAPSSGPFDIGLRFEIEPEWYLYWLNPGDAGLPVEVKWELPEGWTAGPLRFPTPEKIVKGGITAFGYHNELVLLCRITPAEGSHSLDTIRAALDWLVCRESCLPGRAWLALELNPDRLKGIALEQARLAEYEARFPRPIEICGVSVGPLVLEADGLTVLATIEISGSDTLKITDFYPEPIEGFATDFSDIQILGNRICLRLTPEAGSSVVRSLKGLAIIQNRGYRLEASVSSE